MFIAGAEMIGMRWAMERQQLVQPQCWWLALPM
jgi:hypothetical protein